MSLKALNGSKKLTARDAKILNSLNALNGSKKLTARDAKIYARDAKKTFNVLKSLKWFKKINRKERKGNLHCPSMP
jgi:hypothetical protein